MLNGSLCHCDGALCKIACWCVQDTGASGKRRPGHFEAEVVAQEGPLWPAEPCGRPARGTSTAPAQFCGGLLYPGRGVATGAACGCSGDMVEQQPLPQRAAQRGDRWQLHRPGPKPQPTKPDQGHGGHSRSPSPAQASVQTQTPGPPGAAQRCHCHTLLYGSGRRWCQPRFSRAAVHPVIIGVPLSHDSSTDIMWLTHSAHVGREFGVLASDSMWFSLILKTFIAPRLIIVVNLTLNTTLNCTFQTLKLYFWVNEHFSCTIALFIQSIQVLTL